MNRLFISSLAALLPCIAQAAPVTTILHAFADIPSFGTKGPRDGFYPQAGLAGDPATALYGTTAFGGTSCGSNGPGCGSVFQMTPPAAGKKLWKETVLARFNDTATGGYPSGALIIGPGGVLYGTTAHGGIGPSGGANGTVFELTPPALGKTAWTRKVLYEFAGGADGAFPLGRLLQDSNGILYGTTQAGGAAGDGTVFALTPPPAGKKTWTKATIYSFSGSDGASPVAGLILTSAGTLAGTTNAGGSQGFGVVFALTPPEAGGTAWSQSILFDFTQLSVSAGPASDLIEDSSGNLYGTTAIGGTSGKGTVFELLHPATGKTVWKLNVLYNFLGGTDGATPLAGVTADTNGNLYGTTEAGGASNDGTAYMLTPPKKGTVWTETQLHSFTGGADGTIPTSTVLIGSDGTVYGTSRQGGDGCPALTEDGCGTVFSIVP